MSLDIRISVYQHADKALWDNLIELSNHNSFLFKRGFMDYHEDRFNDFSLMFFAKDELLGVLPLHREENICFSHSGLTYGGFVLKPQLKFEVIKTLVKSSLEFLKRQGIKSLKLKMIPRIYQHR
ncbi:MAG: GNAT family N-acetyltransferase, partial [Bacteroidota bacterium]